MPESTPIGSKSTPRSFGSPDFCSQQKDLIEAFEPWYGPKPYSYNASAPAGL
jgi:hypothetical protein